MLSDLYNSLTTKYSIRVINSFYFPKTFLDATFSTMSHNLYARYKDG